MQAGGLPQGGRVGLLWTAAVCLSQAGLPPLFYRVFLAQTRSPLSMQVINSEVCVTCYSFAFAGAMPLNFQRVRGYAV